MFPTRESLPGNRSDGLRPQATGSILDGDLEQASVLAASALVAAVIGGACLAAVAAWLSSPSATEEIGFILVGLSLPLLIAGALRTLQLGTAARFAAGTGFAAAIGALIMFAVWFPDHWTTSLSTPNGYAVVQYGIGLLLMTASGIGTGAARIAEAGAQARRLILMQDARVTREAEADLQEAREQAYTWGGVPEQRPSARLLIREDVDGFEVASVARGDRISVEPADRVDQAVRALKGLRGRGRRPRRWLEAPVAGNAANLQSVRQSDEGPWRSRPWWKRVIPPYG